MQGTRQYTCSIIHASCPSGTGSRHYIARMFRDVMYGCTFMHLFAQSINNQQYQRWRNDDLSHAFNCNDYEWWAVEGISQLAWHWPVADLCYWLNRCAIGWARENNNTIKIIHQEMFWIVWRYALRSVRFCFCTVWMMCKGKLECSLCTKNVFHKR